MALIPKRFATFFSIPIFRRAAFHVKRLTSGLDSSFFFRVGIVLAGFLLIASALVTLAERETEGHTWDTLGEFLSQFMDWLYWSLTTVMGAGDSSQVHTPTGYLFSWLLILFGVAIVASLTGALVGFLIDYLLKEGQGMGASGYRDHIIVCGWNATARELIQELSTDEYTTKIVVIHDGDKNPAGDGVYFVSGDITTAHDLKRAGIEDAQAAVVCPADGSNEADMKSILCVMAIESLAPHVRTVVEVNNPAHVEHFQRAEADEILVSSQLVSRLMARSSLYPGLAGLVTDIVSGGEGSELYRVQLPDDYVGFSVDDLSAKLRADHRATLLSVSRGGQAYVNPPEDFRLAIGDDLIVVAESLGTLEPLEMDHDLS
ncbi:MAG TPA: NAD-binding protein [Nocardioides sp.]|nr:NAD-binding protein [Nocardioides sp.]